jgi:hypothetical protein
METGQIWNSLEVAKLGAQLITPLVVAVFGYWITIRLKAQERRFGQLDEQSRERERLEREARKEELERRYTPHIELRVDCQFLGARNGQLLTTFSVLATNAGQILHKFQRVILRVRGIKDGRFEYWEGKEPRARTSPTRYSRQTLFRRSGTSFSSSRA